MVLMSFSQVFLVSANVAFIGELTWVGIVVTSFGINWLWTHNVRRAVFGSEFDRVVYALAATVGCVCGVHFSMFLK